MCRLLGYVAGDPASVVDLLGTGAFEDFTDLSVVHSDGWGMAWRTPADVEVVVSPGSAYRDPAYRHLAARPLASAGLVHLRWATEGLAIAPENTHPFTDRGFTLAHNGSITPLHRLEAMLSTRARRALRGTTDSERYFQFILDRIEALGDERDGVLDAVAILTREFPTASLNAILLSESSLFAIHVNAAAVPPLAGLRERMGPGYGLPRGHDNAYFAMAYRRDALGLRVVSTGMDPEGWAPLPPDTVLHVDLATVEERLLDVRDRTAHLVAV